ncbi:shikimate kinase [Roseibacillus persicicus]|uniref:Shikimate kinase n=1 Tax=Roseibacillus persicicus TaxID=454148 RepID=A0A918THV3_9BACT|nr:shikimate kinase [Roseibacillus persicicus]MDQ8190352.1 shikimate kinase [Roseibacillus persicicus]GHC46597.1 shikimate kinase [Roseibacillus persicicus]
MLKNLVLVGFMGTGKSTIGRQLSKALGYPLIDTDARIIAQQKRPIADIFAKEGEEFFRDLETQVLHSLTEDKCHKRIIATGGGIILREENRKLLRELGFVVWLVAQPETILERTSRNKERPLLDIEDPAERIRTMLEARNPLYDETSHLILETTSLSFSEITTGIIESARYHYGSQ